MEVVIAGVLVLALVWGLARNSGKGTCRECGQRVSQQAKVCPFCGQRFDA